MPPSERLSFRCSWCNIILALSLKPMSLAPCHCCTVGHPSAGSSQFLPGSTVSPGLFLWLTATLFRWILASLLLIRRSASFHCSILPNRCLAMDYCMSVCLQRECVFGEVLASSRLPPWLHYSGFQASRHNMKLLGPYVLLSTLFSNSISLYSLGEKDKVSCPYKTMCKTVGLCILFFKAKTHLLVF
jgi:hypothetical protein